MSDTDLKARIKQMMVTSLMLKVEPSEISDTAPLFSPEGLGLDSIDALELAVGLEKHFGVATPNAEVAKQAFLNVETVADYVSRNAKAQS